MPFDTVDGEMLLTKESDNAIYNNNLAMSYADANLKPGRAHALALKANRLSPDNPGHLDTLGWVLIRLKQFDEAEEAQARIEELQRELENAEFDLSEARMDLAIAEGSAGE